MVSRIKNVSLRRSLADFGGLPIFFIHNRETQKVALSNLRRGHPGATVKEVGRMGAGTAGRTRAGPIGRNHPEKGPAHTEILLVSDHPVCGVKVGFAEIFLMPQTPLLTRRGIDSPERFT